MNGISMSLFLFIISGIFLVVSLFQKNSNFLDVRLIILQHLKVFRGNPLQFFSIYIIPIFMAIAIMQIQCIDKEIVSNLNIVLSILISMLFAILSILCVFQKKDKEEAEKKYNQLLRETFNATIFEILLCLILLLISFLQLFLNVFEKSLLLILISGTIYYLAIVVVLNILVIIKRLKVLFDNA